MFVDVFSLFCRVAEDHLRKAHKTFFSPIQNYEYNLVTLRYIPPLHITTLPEKKKRKKKENRKRTHNNLSLASKHNHQQLTNEKR